jgi:adenine deaminase
MDFSLSGQIVDVVNSRIFSGTVHCAAGRIKNIVAEPTSAAHLIMPGLVDAHIHIESSMLVPSEFARLAVVHGTVATVSDPHEIGNVMGIEGVKYMIENARTVPLKFYFGAPSCAPATSFETSGATLGVSEIESLLKLPEIHYLSEMMNYPGVIHKDPLVMSKIEVAKRFNKPMDGHAPGLRGQDLDAYLSAGISTDHESFTYTEGLEKLQKGMKLIIREGSAAKNFEALIPLLAKFPEKVMFCSDDKHPDDLIKGHINQLLQRAVAKGYNPLHAIKAATLNPVHHYKLGTGLLQKNDPATFIVVEDLTLFKVLATYIDGEKVAEKGKALFQAPKPQIINHFHCLPITEEQLKIPASQDKKIRVIQAINGELITKTLEAKPKIRDGFYECDPQRDILKLVVLNRYQNAKPAVAFVNNFGIKKGALASTVAHDSHNIIAVGTSDRALTIAINSLVASKGGIVVYDGNSCHNLALPVAGLMTTADGESVAKQYEKMNELIRSLGGSLTAPFMTLSFLALLVIPQLKLSDKGLFDGQKFTFVSLEI